MDTFFYRKSEETHLAPLNRLGETCDFSQIQRIKSQKWLTFTGSPTYQCIVPSFSYRIVLKVLAATHFRSRDKLRNLPYLTVSPAFLHRECPEGFSE